MLYLWTLLWCIPSPYLFIINAEGWVVFHAINSELNPWLLGITAALGQTVGYIIAYLFAEKLMRRWERLRKRVDGFDVNRFDRSAVLTLIGASTISVPPFIVTAAVAGLVKYNLPRFIVISILGRILRFCLLAYFPFLLDKYCSIF